MVAKTSYTASELGDIVTKSLSSFEASVCITAEGGVLPAPAQVYGELQVYKHKYRLDLYPGEEEPGEGEVEELISLVSSWQGEESRWHRDTDGVVSPLEQHLRLERQGPADEDQQGQELLVEMKRDAIRTLELFHLGDLLDHIGNADWVEDEEAEAEGSASEGPRVSSAFREDGLRFTFHFDNKVKTVVRIEQELETDVSAVVKGQLSDRRQKALTSTAPYRVYLTLERMAPWTVDHSRFTMKPECADSSSTSRPASAAGSNKKAPAGPPAGRKHKPPKGKGRPDWKPLSGCIDMDDELAVPFDEFWKEFLTEESSQPIQPNQPETRSVGC